MRKIILAGVFILALARPTLADTARCTTREDPPFKRWLTTCTAGSRAVTKSDEAFKRYRTDVSTPPKSDKAPRGWPTPGKPPRWGLGKIPPPDGPRTHDLRPGHTLGRGEGSGFQVLSPGSRVGC
jgi:hypothetical protein